MKKMVLALSIILASSMCIAADKTVMLSGDDLDPKILEKLKNGNLSQKELLQLLDKKNMQEKESDKPQVEYHFGKFSIIAHEGDDIDAAASHIGYAYSRFEYLYGEAPYLTVVLIDGINGMGKIEMPKDGRRYLPFIKGGSFQKALSHEVCHMLLMDDEALKSKKNVSMTNYGHSDLPDWLDETVAVSCELPTLKRERLAGFESRNLKINWDTFLTQSHPLVNSQSKFTKKILNERDREKLLEESKNKQVVRMITLTEEQLGDLKPEVDKAKDFYYRSGVVGQVLEDNFGRGVLKDIAEAIKNGVNFEDWLSNQIAVTNLPMFDRKIHELYD